MSTASAATLMSPARAKRILFQLQADPRDDWGYRIEKRGRYWVILVIDQTGEVIGYL